MKKQKRELRDPYFMYLGNLLIFNNGIGSISDIKYVVIREKKHIFARPRHFAFPGGQEVIVGNYEINAANNEMPVLINAEHLHDAPWERKIDASEVRDIIIENNDIKKLRKVKF